MGRAVRGQVETYLRGVDFAAATAGLGDTSRWPRAGTALMLAAMGPLLTGPHRSPRFNRLLAAIVEKGILARDESRRGGLGSRYRRFAFFLACSAERERRQREGGAVRDILDTVLDLAGDAPTEQLIEVYLGFVFALVSSVGFALGWSVLLALRHGETAQPAKHIVSEALRLYPIAWLLGRRPSCAHRLAGIEVGPADEVLVSPYAVQRSTRHWPRPTEFVPARWRDTRDRSAWLPFGAGPHTCAAVSATFQILERVLGALFAARDLRLVEAGGGPAVGAALAPPPFTLSVSR